MKRETDFGPPIVAPGLNPVDPQARKYAEEVAARRSSAAIPKYTTPVGGPPLPPIPYLDQAPAGDRPLTMADHANTSRMPPPGSILNPPPGGTGGLALFPSDVLPNEVREDAHFREGAGAMLAVNQPNLAAKYGVIRNGNKIPPQQLTGQRQGGGGGLKAETVEGLKAVEEFNKSRQKSESGDTKIEADAAAGPAGAAARIANGMGDDQGVKPASPEELQRRINDMDDFDFNAFRQAMMKDLLNNDEQRKMVEDRLAPMDLTSLIMHGFIEQTVPIVPGKFEPEFRSMSTEDDLALKRLIMEETKSISAPAQYMLDKYSVMSACCGVTAINKRPLPDFHDAEGHFDDEAFRKKFNLFCKYPFHMVASLGIHFFWFDIRVRKLFVVEKIKNG